MTTTNSDNLLGFYASFNGPGKDQDEIKNYLWGKNGLKEKLLSIKWQDYGNDFHLILFQFHTNPIPYERENLRIIENYRRKEKAIGIPIIVDDDNFFNLKEIQRQLFFKQTMIERLGLLKEKVKRNKLDLDIDKLICDVEAKFTD
jgi:hypothetical protein